MQSLNNRFVPRAMIDSDAILSLDEDMKFNPDEVSIYVVNGLKPGVSVVCLVWSSRWGVVFRESVVGD